MRLPEFGWLLSRFFDLLLIGWLAYAFIQYRRFRERIQILSIVFILVMGLTPYLTEGLSSIAAQPIRGISMINAGLVLIGFAGFLKFFVFSETWAEKNARFAEAGELEEALRASYQAVKLNPNYALLWHQKGWTQLKLGEYEAALKSYNQALDLNPNNWRMLHEKGWAQCLLEDSTGAIKSFNRALEVAKRKPDMQETYAALALVQAKSGQLDEALVSYEKAGNGDPHVLFNKSLCLHQLGRLEAAERTISMALDINAFDRAAWELRGEILEELGRPKEANDCYKKSASP